MYRPISILLLLLVLAALTADILIHSRPVQAQSSPTVYIDEANVRGLRGGKEVDITIKGTQVIGFSCAPNVPRCYVLSK
jgi:ABC-type transporter Mla subunit MlaD